jgi:sulfate permease, SulP family
VIYRYDAPLCFANAENFRKRAIEAIDAETTPVEWFVLNTDAVLEIDITAADMLKELHRELIARKITFAMARVKQDLYVQLRRVGLIDEIGAERIYPTLHEAIEAFQNCARAI